MNFQPMFMANLYLFILVPVGIKQVFSLHGVYSPVKCFCFSSAFIALNKPRSVISEGLSLEQQAQTLLNYLGVKFLQPSTSTSMGDASASAQLEVL